MRICLLSSGHRPDDDRIFYKEAKSLAKKYDDVWIISPHPEKIPKKNEGIKFCSIPHARSLLGRFRSMKKLYETALNLKADIYHCHEPESLMVAIRLKKVLGCKIIFDSHEMYSASFSQRFPEILRNPIISAYKLFERTKIDQCDYTLGASWAIADYLRRIVGPDRTEIILNCALPEIFGKVLERKWEKETIVCHDGHLSFSRGLKTMVKAIEIVRKKYPVKFKIVGDVFGAEKKWLETYITTHNMNGVIERTGWLDYHDVGAAIGECHIGLLALQKLPNHIIAAPNKVFNYMYFALPFVAPNHCLWIDRLSKEEECGLSADSASAISYANAISYLIENRKEATAMGLNARNASEKNYLWTHMEDKLFNVYKSLELKQ